jgi:hypothetical protein
MEELLSGTSMVLLLTLNLRKTLAALAAAEETVADAVEIVRSDIEGPSCGLVARPLVEIEVLCCCRVFDSLLNTTVAASVTEEEEVAGVDALWSLDLCNSISNSCTRNDSS